MTKSEVLLSVGEVMAEWLFDLPQLPSANTTQVVQGVSRQLGGPALNVSWYLSALGRTARLVSAIGYWDQGLLAEIYLDTMIDTGGLIAVRSETDTLFGVLLKEAHHSVYAMADLPLDFEDQLVSQCFDATVLAMNGGRHAEVRRAFIRLCGQFTGKLLAFNPSYAIYEYSATELRALLQKSDISIVNRQEFYFMKQATGWQEDELVNQLSGILIVTLGGDGAKVIQGQVEVSLPSCAQKEGLAIGAGDAFFAGFIHEKLRGGSLKSCAEYGAALAALVVESSVVRCTVTDAQVLNRRELAFGSHASR